MSNQTSPHSDSLWYYADTQNQPVGPLPFRTIQTLAAAGVIQPGTQVVESGGTEWKKFAAVVLFTPPPPPPIRTESNSPTTATICANAATPAQTTSTQGKHGKLDEKLARGYGAVILILIIGVFTLVKCSNSESTPKAGGKTSEELANSVLIITDIENAPIEYGIVFLDSGHLPRGNDINAARIRFLLKAIGEKSGDSSKMIADTASRATGVIKSQYGRNVTIQKFLEQAYQVLESGGKRDSITALAPILIMLMGR